MIVSASSSPASSSSLELGIYDAINRLRATNPDFQEAYDSYAGQYGSDVIAVNEPLLVSGTVDPVVLILGRTCSIHYKDSTRELFGSLGKLKLPSESVCIIGRRNSFDSKLIAWSPTDDLEVDLEVYNPLAGTIPSRVHGALVTSRYGEAWFTDLSSSSGTIVVGEFVHGRPFVRAFDTGSPQFPAIKFERTSMSRKR